MSACICLSCGDIGIFRTRRGMTLADQPCPKCGGKRTTTCNFRVAYHVTKQPKWNRWVRCFTLTEAQRVAKAYRSSTMFGGYTIDAVEQRVSGKWVAVEPAAVPA